MSELEPTRTCSNPTATDELRRMLDERGVEWLPIAWNSKRETFYHAANGVGFCADEYANGVKIYTDATITPEQAIAATLGSCNCSNNCSDSEQTGTCSIKPWKVERDTGFFDCMECSECGYVTDVSEWAKATYCAGCGRRIKQ